MWRSTLLLLLLIGAACRSPFEPRRITVAPAAFDGFPSANVAEGVRATAIYDPDLVRADVLSVRLAVSLAEERGDRARLTADTIEPYLYLQDGTVLSWIPVVNGKADWPRPASRAVRGALPLTSLPVGNEALSGYVSFRIPPEVRVQAPFALTSQGELHHELDLRNSLLSFHVYTDTGLRRVFVGLAADVPPGG